jgi:hypothetical protein
MLRRPGHDDDHDKDDDAAFVWVKEWFLDQKYLKSIRRVDVDTTLRGQNVSLVPAPVITGSGTPDGRFASIFTEVKKPMARGPGDTSSGCSEPLAGSRVLCANSRPARLVPFKVSQCTGYPVKRIPSRRDKEEIA